MNNRFLKFFCHTRILPLVLIFLLALGGTGYWYFAVRPFLHVANARLAAPFLEVRSDLAGRLTYAPHKEGDWVKQGETLFSLCTFEERQQQKQLQTSVDTFQKTLTYYLSAVEKATQDYIAARRDSDLDIESENSAEHTLTILQQQQQVANECKQELGVAEARLEKANHVVLQKSMSAPFSGMIVKRQKREGDLLLFGDTVYSLCDLNQVWVEARIDEKDIGKIAIGQKATIFLPLENNRVWEGAVTWISPIASAPKEGVEIRISLNKKEGALILPNLSADVKIQMH